MKQQIATEEEELDKLQQRMACVKEAQVILQQAAQAVQQIAHEQIASIVTRCLSAVFGEDAYEFKIDFQRKRGKTEANLLFVRDGKEVDPTTSAGGGVIDIASFALRLAALLLSRPRKRKLLVLDEPWKHLSRNYRPQIRELIMKLSKELDVQFVIVTHANELKIGKVVELE